MMFAIFGAVGVLTALGVAYGTRRSRVSVVNLSIAVMLATMVVMLWIEGWQFGMWAALGVVLHVAVRWIVDLWVARAGSSD